jgi:hypothetical protein
LVGRYFDGFQEPLSMRHWRCLEAVCSMVSRFPEVCTSSAYMQPPGRRGRSHPSNQFGESSTISQKDQGPSSIAIGFMFLDDQHAFSLLSYQDLFYQD